MFDHRIEKKLIFYPIKDDGKFRLLMVVYNRDEIVDWLILSVQAVKWLKEYFTDAWILATEHSTKLPEKTAYETELERTREEIKEKMRSRKTRKARRGGSNEG